MSEQFTDYNGLPQVDGALFDNGPSCESNMKFCPECKKFLRPESFRIRPDRGTSERIVRYSRCVDCHRKWSRQWHAKNPKRAKHLMRKYRLKNNFGLTVERYEEMLRGQNERCAICKEHKDSFDKAFAVDHCHKTGRIRGLLCSNCNAGVGFFRDDPKNLVWAIEYLDFSNRICFA